MLLLETKNIQGRMTPLELRLENACPRVFVSGCTDGDIRGANVTGSFASTRLLICERGLDYRQGEERERGSKICLDWSTILWGCLLGLLAVLSKCREAMSSVDGWQPHIPHLLYVLKSIFCCAVLRK